MKRLTYMLGAAALLLATLGTIALGGIGVSAQDEHTVTLQNADGDEVGTASFQETDQGLAMVIEVEPETLEAGTAYRVDLHNVGECDPEGPEPFASAGDPIQPLEEEEILPDATPAAPEALAAGLGIVFAEDDGSLLLEVVTDVFALEPADPGTLSDQDGSALIVHVDTSVNGEADMNGHDHGERVLCGVVFEGDETAVDHTPMATPEPVGAGDATPVAAADLGTEFTMNMEDFFYDPDHLAIPANTDVTIILPNVGGVVHNFYSDQLEVYTTNVDPGRETTVTINAGPGEYEFYCGIPGHRESGMVGVLTIVE
jgi:superoxide dismutase, Cu-Zn family